MTEAEAQECFQKMMDVILGNKQELIGEGFIKSSDLSEIAEA